MWGDEDKYVKINQRISFIKITLMFFCRERNFFRRRSLHCNRKTFFIWAIQEF